MVCNLIVVNKAYNKYISLTENSQDLFVEILKLKTIKVLKFYKDMEEVSIILIRAFVIKTMI